MFALSFALLSSVATSSAVVLLLCAAAPGRIVRETGRPALRRLGARARSPQRAAA